MAPPVPTVADLDAMSALARRIRGDVVSMSHRSGAPHLGSSLSCVDILVAAYWGVLAVDPARPRAASRDRFILSKGHAAAAYYATLARRGFIPLDWLEQYTVDGSPLAEHPSRHCVPGVEVSTGSLGHGLALGIGMAMAGRIQGETYRVVVTMSDGECNEGSVWEAALFAPAQRLDRIVAIVDYNRWQATGRSDEVMALSPLCEKWAAFGWAAQEVDGHDLRALVTALRGESAVPGRPTMIVARTVKGKGVSFMEDDNNWHYRIPTAQEVERAHRELGLIP